MGFDIKDWIFIEEFGKAFIPEFIRPRLRRYLETAGIYEIPYHLFGMLFYLSLAITTGAYLYMWPDFVRYSPFELLIYTFLFWFVVELALALVMMGLIYAYLDIQIFKRTKAMEDVLADFLALFNDNLKTGMTIDKALWRAIKPEFGVLSNEIKIASKRVMTGDDVNDALDDFTRKYDSITLQRAFALVTEGMKTGSELAGIIDRVIDDIRKTAVLKERMIANSISFTIFITIIVVAIAPLLFALSYYLLYMVQEFSKNVVSTPTLNSVMGNIKAAVKLDDLTFFSKMALSIISGFAAMIISIINKGDIRGGIKYVPAFIAGAYAMYIIFMNILGYAFASFVVTG